jgi:hypothetical protein
MKTILSLALIGAVVLGPAAWSPAEEPAAGEPGANPTGKVLILDNERTLEGDIERIGDQYRIRRATGDSWWPGNRVLRLCASTEEAYRFLRGRANLNDPDEHLRLASWCRDHGLREQALNEVKAAVELRPQHPESKSLLQHLQQSSQPRPPTPAPDREEPDPLPSLSVDLTAEAVGQFASRVQPILMNSCAGCHAGDRGGAFKLTRAYDFGSNRRTTRQNLAAVLAEVNLSQPLASPFLTKALGVHGKMAQAPFRNREAPAYRTLEEWVRQTAVLSGRPGDAGPEEVRGPKSEVRSPKSEARGTETARPPAESTGPLPMPAAPREEFASAPRPDGKPGPATTAERPPEPADPWDGENFNREMHPPRKP